MSVRKEGGILDEGECRNSASQSLAQKHEGLEPQMKFLRTQASGLTICCVVSTAMSSVCDIFLPFHKVEHKYFHVNKGSNFNNENPFLIFIT